MTREIQFTVFGEAKAFARAGGHGSVRFTPKPQRDYGAVVRHEAALAMNGEAPWTGPIGLILCVEYLVPQSWSRKKRAAAHCKTSTPDTDNLYKLIADALNRVVWFDDAQIASVHIQKIYGSIERSTITIRSLEGEQT